MSKRDLKLDIVAPAIGLFVVLLVMGIIITVGVNVKAQENRTYSDGLKAQVVAAQTRASDAEEALRGCALAYSEATTVAKELRSEASDSLDAVESYITSYGTSGLDSVAIAVRIEKTNARETAIDGTPCAAAR